MRRITPYDVTEAYRVTGFKPLREAYIECNGDTKLCGLAVVAVAEKRLHWLDIKNESNQTSQFERICGALGIDTDYGDDFVQAFDVPAIKKDSEGVRDGRAAALAVFGS